MDHATELNKRRPWTAQEIEVLRAVKCPREAAKTLGRSYQAVRSKRCELGIMAAQKPVPGVPAAQVQKVQELVASGASAAQILAASTPQTPTTVAEDLVVQDEDYWERQHKDLSKKYHKLLKAENAVERLVSRISALAPLSYTPLPAVWQSPRRSSGQPQSAVLEFSDTHIGKNTSPKQTLSFGNYNFAVFMARLKYLEESIISITENHVNTEVPELVVAMLGDMLDGALTHAAEAGQLDPLFSQFYCGAHAIAQFLRNLAPHFPKIRIYDVVGNHTRHLSQKKMPTKNRFSNFDKFLYALIRELVRDIPNITWTLDAQPYALFDVQGFKFFCAHGDTLRGGDKTLGIPNHAVGRMVSAATQLMTKYNLKNPNYYLLGHLHRDIVLPHATGSVLVNGGFPGVDEFGLSEFFTPADPSQKFFFMHPTYGKTATYDISLKFAQVGAPPYTVPAEFTLH